MELQESYDPNYFSIDEILATQERIPCKFEVEVNGLGHLDQSSGSEDIEVGSKLELPCWLAKDLITSKKSIVSAQIPIVYRDRYREILKADASVLNLHKLGPYFYEVGLNVLPLAGHDSSTLALLLCKTLRERLRKVMDGALNAAMDIQTIQMTDLDELERTLFCAGQTSLRDHELWIARKTHVIKSSLGVDKAKKRKFSDLKS